MFKAEIFDHFLCVQTSLIDKAGFYRLVTERQAMAGVFLDSTLGTKDNASDSHMVPSPGTKPSFNDE